MCEKTKTQLSARTETKFSVWWGDGISKLCAGQAPKKCVGGPN